jgi:large subunit ribosomal protein L25
MAGRVPAIFYGGRRTPQALSVDYKEYRTLLAGHDQGGIFKLVIEDPAGAQEKVAMVKDHQVHPVKRTVMHVDFYEVAMDQPLTMEIPLVFDGKAPGVERGGLLSQVQHRIAVSGLPQNLPDQIMVDVSELNVGDSIHVTDLVMPEGVRAVYDDNYTVATVTVPKGAKVAAGEGEAAAE